MRIPSEFIAVCTFIIDVVPCFISDAIIDISQRGGAAVTSQGDMRSETGFCSDNMGGVIGAARGPSA